MKYWIISLFFTVLNIYFLNAQCDCPTNIPPPMIIISGPINNGKIMLLKGETSINISYRNSTGDKLLAGDVDTVSAFNTQYTFNYLGVLAIYGLSNRVNFETESGFYTSKVTDYYGEYKSSKFSHLALSAKYNLFDDSFTDEWIVSAGIKFPLSDQKIDTNRSVKPTNSSFGFTLSSIYNLTMNRKMNLLFSIKYDYNLKNKYNSKFGNAISSGITYRYTLSDAINLALGLSFDNRERELINNKDFEKSGSKTALITPNITYRFDFPIYINLAVPYPVYQYYNGVQSAMKYSFAISAGYGF